MKKLATLLSLAAALAVAVPVAAQARHGADDPVGHVRHSGNHRGGDARRQQQQQPAGTTNAAVSTSSRSRGADDAPGDNHGGHGADDGPNHS